MEKQVILYRTISTSEIFIAIGKYTWWLAQHYNRGPETLIQQVHWGKGGHSSDYNDKAELFNT